MGRRGRLPVLAGRDRPARRQPVDLAAGPADRRHAHWSLDHDVGALALRRGGGAVLALADGFYFFDFASGRLELISHVDADQPRTRLNDGKCDRRGRFFAGGMDDKEELKICGLWRLDPDLSRDAGRRRHHLHERPVLESRRQDVLSGRHVPGRVLGLRLRHRDGIAREQTGVRSHSGTMPAWPTARRSTRTAACGTRSSSPAISFAMRLTARVERRIGMPVRNITSVHVRRRQARRALRHVDGPRQTSRRARSVREGSEAAVPGRQPVQSHRPRRSRAAGAAICRRKVIITCAVTGAIHTPTMSPHLPVTPDEIAASAIGAANAGAAIVHLHARDPRDGRPTQDPDRFRAFLPRIAAASDVIVNLTTGGSQAMTVEERLQPALQLRPEVASLNMGTMNFGLYEMLPRYREWKWDWEPEYLAGSEAGFFKNTLKDIADILRAVRRPRHPVRARVLRYRPSVHGRAFSRSRPAHAAAASSNRCSVFAAASARIRRTCLHEARGRPVVRRRVSVVGRRAGRHQMSICRQAAGLGGHVRVGLEDSLWIDKGTARVVERRAGGQGQGDARRDGHRCCDA